jgi:hypothetical protein
MLRTRVRMCQDIAANSPATNIQAMRLIVLVELNESKNCSLRNQQSDPRRSHQSGPLGSQKDESLHSQSRTAPHKFAHRHPLSSPARTFRVLIILVLRYR